MKNSQRMTARKAQQLKQKKMLTLSHILIAVVALIECCLLIVFTTYSWIESSSSLIIKNGPQTTVSDDVVNLDISDTLNYKVNLDTELAAQDVNSFFRRVKYYEFAKSTSPDGETFFFPRNGSNKFRKGDTTDYNTAYYYFDFVINKSTNHGQDFFFDPGYIFGDKSIFSVSGGETSLSEAELSALKSAMRISVTAENNSGKTTAVYSTDGSTYNTISADAESPNGSNLTANVVPRKISDYVYAAPSSGGAATSQKLFSATKNQDTKVSVRIWFDLMDTSFKNTFGYNPASGTYSNTDYAEIPGAEIGVKFSLKCMNNDYQTVYFDDYTFSNTSDVHLTDENSDYKMWFCAYRPATAAASAGEVWLEMSKLDTTDSYNRWYTDKATTEMMSSDSGNGMSSEHISSAKFVYADSTHSDALYEWQINAAPATEEYIYNAYSNVAYRSSASTQAANYGVGVWDNGGQNSLTLLYFNDKATGKTTVEYNGASQAEPNFRFMNADAESDIVTHGGSRSKNIVFVNNSDFGDSDAGYVANYSADVAKTTAAMYYDEDAELFKSYVPASWLAGDNAGAYFSYCPQGYFSRDDTAERWFGASPAASGDGTYTFTALGFREQYLTLYGITNQRNFYFVGVGTWGDYEKVTLSAELIDSDSKPAYRYFVGVKGYSQHNDWYNYYSLIPNKDNTAFYAYIPKGAGTVEGEELKFTQDSTYRVDFNSGAVPTNAYWNTNVRTESDLTYYPVKIDSSSSAENTGYWNVSVLVDATYEHLIYDTLTDDDYGTLEYSYDNEHWTKIADDSNDSFTNKLDAYRFYAPAEGAATVYWRWTPYDGGTYDLGDNEISYESTVFTYTHDSSDGIYRLVTEAENAVTANEESEG